MVLHFAKTIAGSDCLIIKVLSPIRKCKDKAKECDVILGKAGMARLRLGIDQATRGLYVKHRTSLRRIGKRVAAVRDRGC